MTIVIRELGHNCVVPTTLESRLGPRLPPAFSNTKWNSEAYVYRLWQGYWRGENATATEPMGLFSRQTPYKEMGTMQESGDAKYGIFPIS